MTDRGSSPEGQEEFLDAVESPDGMAPPPEESPQRKNQPKHQSKNQSKKQHHRKPTRRIGDLIERWQRHSVDGEVPSGSDTGRRKKG